RRLAAGLSGFGRGLRRHAWRESGHRRRLLELFRVKFGEHMPLFRRQDIRGFVHHKPVWLIRPLGLETVRNQVRAMEMETRRVYERRKTLVSGSCWITWRRRSGHMKFALKRWIVTSWDRMPSETRMRQ